jgi:DNA-binding NarL/FixJ family response regulator
VLLARVLELWDQVPDAAERIGADHVRVLEESALAAGDAGEPKRGLAFVESALSELDEATDPVRVALLLSKRHLFKKDLGLPEDMNDLDRALGLVPEALSKQARTQLLLVASHYSCHTGGGHFADWAEDALRLARELGDRDAEAQALTALAGIKAGPLGLAEPGGESFRLIAQARQIAEEIGAYQPIIKLVIYESHLLCGAGEYERAAVVAREGIADAERQGLARTRGAFLAINVAEPLMFLGRWDEAVEVAERALDLAPPTLTRVGLWIACASIALARGDIATAVKRATASRTVLSGSRYNDQEHLPQAVLDIELSLAAKGPAAAVDLAAEMVAQYDLSGSSPRYVWPLLATAAAAARQARGDEADALLCKLRTLAEKHDVSGPVQRAWQLSYAAIDPLPDDGTAGPVSVAARLAAADAAVAAWEAIDQPYPAALALVGAAQVALSGGSSGREPAAARLRRAALLAEHLGARPLAEQITALLLRTAGTGHGAGTERERLGLTGRELEVLRLVTAGQSNREIAAALFISPKTASVHVSNILAKLGAATRTEAAARAHALRLFDPDTGR